MGRGIPSENATGAVDRGGNDHWSGVLRSVIDWSHVGAADVRL